MPEVVSKLDKTDVLPAATLTVRLFDDYQIRAAYNRTVNRPDLRELSAQAYYDIELNATTVGNPDLKRAVIDAADLRLEWYLSPDEVFSLGGFYKKIDNAIEISVVPSAAGDTYSLSNAKKAFLAGFEVEGRKRFGFIHRKLEPLFLSGNFSWIKSKVDFEFEVSGAKGSRPLQSQSPWVVNASLGYDDDVEGGSGTAVTLLYNVAGERLRAVGDVQNKRPDQYEQSFHQLDLVISQRLKRGFTIGFRGQNLLNSTQRWKADDIVVRRFKRGAYLTLNLGWSY
jgi:TonB-dependent receptor